MKKTLAVLTMLVMVMATISIASAADPAFPAKFPPKQSSILVLAEKGTLIEYNYENNLGEIADRKADYWTYKTGSDVIIYEKYYETTTKYTKKKIIKTWVLKNYNIITIIQDTQGGVWANYNRFDNKKKFIDTRGIGFGSVQTPWQAYKIYKEEYLLNIPIH